MSECRAREKSHKEAVNCGLPVREADPHVPHKRVRLVLASAKMAGRMRLLGRSAASDMPSRQKRVSSVVPTAPSRRLNRLSPCRARRWSVHPVRSWCLPSPAHGVRARNPAVSVSQQVLPGTATPPSSCFPATGPAPSSPLQKRQSRRARVMIRPLAANTARTLCR